MSKDKFLVCYWLDAASKHDLIHVGPALKTNMRTECSLSAKFIIEIEIMMEKLYLFSRCFTLLLIIEVCSAVVSGFSSGTHIFSMQAIRCTGTKEGRQCGGFTTNANSSFIYTFRANSTSFYLFSYSPIN